MAGPRQPLRRSRLSQSPRRPNAHRRHQGIHPRRLHAPEGGPAWLPRARVAGKDDRRGGQGAGRGRRRRGDRGADRDRQVDGLSDCRRRSGARAEEKAADRHRHHRAAGTAGTARHSAVPEAQRPRGQGRAGQGPRPLPVPAQPGHGQQQPAGHRADGAGLRGRSRAVVQAAGRARQAGAGQARRGVRPPRMGRRHGQRAGNPRRPAARHDHHQRRRLHRPQMRPVHGLPVLRRAPRGGRRGNHRGQPGPGAGRPDHAARRRRLRRRDPASPTKCCTSSTKATTCRRRRSTAAPPKCI